MALVVTLLLLAVITFLAVTFLALSRRERNASNVSVEQATARLAAESAVERAKAEMLARVLGTTNFQNLRLWVSTNFQNWDGFDPSAQPFPYGNGTNVNYGWRRDGLPLTPTEMQENLANLLYSPRPPVYVTNRLLANSMDFRYYLDLNRNGRYDTNGLWPLIVTNSSGFLSYISTNGIDTYPVNPGAPPPIGVVTNYFNGDPEWIGVLARPDEPHGPDNLFLSRYAYVVIPAGQTLDINYIHNYAKLIQQTMPPGSGDGFLRNQGMGPWEINLAAGLADLNTNQWMPALNPYFYYTNRAIPNRGAAFDDALSLLRYRYSLNNLPNYNWLRPVAAIYPGGGGSLNGAVAFGRDGFDGYSDGPLFVNPYVLTTDDDLVRAQRYPWSGDDNPSHFFTSQEFFDTNKTAMSVTPGSLTFTDRLRDAGRAEASEDRYTYYRFLEQFGTDSAAEGAGKINLNYDNLVQRNPVSGDISATNFYDWDPVTFFNNAADRLLQRYTRVWLDENPQLFLNTYGTNQPFGLGNIPVWINNTFVYTPSIHRLLQMAANITDALTNRTFGATVNAYPSVFRPVFNQVGNNIYIRGYQEVIPITGLSDLQLSKPRELTNSVVVGPNDNVYGVPWVIGAKKGLPNFNEFAMQSIFQMTRKIQVRKPSVGAVRSTWQTDVMTVVGVTNVIGVEAWNSYRNNYTRDVEIVVDNDMTMVLTNSDGLRRIHGEILRGALSIPRTGPQQWQGFYPGQPNSFKIPLRTNINFLPDSAYLPATLTLTTNWNFGWDRSQTYLQPQWGLQVTNRLRFIMYDKATGRIIDYVQLDGLNGMRDLSGEIRDPDFQTGFNGLWSTNRGNSGLLQGMENQIGISLGNFGGGSADWTAFGVNQLASGNTKDLEIDKFRVFFGLSPLRYPALRDTNLVMQVPFTPTRRVSQHLTWQANDPLVHYLPGDLAYLPTADSIIKENLKTQVQPIKNVGSLNERYQPWGGNPLKQGGDPNVYEITLKDPLVASSDDWLFPTNKFASLGQLGRIHRGTPWQTIFMKSPDVNTNVSGTMRNPWQVWSGNPSYFDAMRTRPIGDRLLFDVFTTAINDNSTRGLLSINQSGLAAWSALFSGVPALTNASTDAQLNAFRPVKIFNPWIIDPVGTDGTNSPLYRLWAGINRTRSQFAGGTFHSLGDILAVPEMTTNSPFLNLSSGAQLQKGIPDALYEWLPQQVMGLLRLGDPRFVIYAYGQTLKPAERAILTGGQFSGMVTNYQITAEMAVRAVVRVVGSPDVRDEFYDPNNPPSPLDPTKHYTTDREKCYPPRIVFESFNLLPPD